MGSCLNCSCSLLNLSRGVEEDQRLSALVVLLGCNVGFCRYATLPSIGIQCINKRLRLNRPVLLSQEPLNFPAEPQRAGAQGPVTKPRSGGLLLHKMCCMSIRKLLSGNLIPWDFKQPHFLVFDINGTFSKWSARWSSWLCSP